MLKNYLAAALRNLARNRLYAAINVAGLSIGFAAALLIGLFVRHETTFDTFLPGHENIYRISSELRFSANGSNATETVRGSTVLGMKVDFPQIQSIARIARPFEGVSLRYGDVERIENRFYYADANFFEVMPLPAYAGMRGTACSMDILNNFGTGTYVGPDGRQVTLQYTQVGAGMLELLGLKPIAGRFFVRGWKADGTEPFATDAFHRVIINQAASRLLGFESEADAVGKVVSLPTGQRREIIGVVPDFSRETVRAAIEPMFYENSAGFFTQLNVKLRGDRVPETLAAIEGLWNRRPGTSRLIDRRFFDQYVDDLYRGLMRQSALFTGFATVALLIAMLTVSTHAILVARANPVMALRYE